MPNMNTKSLTVRKLLPMFKRRSKVTITRSKFMLPLERPIIRRAHLPNVEALSLMVKKLWLKMKFFRSRSKVTVKVTCLKFMVPPERSCHKEHTYQI